MSGLHQSWTHSECFCAQTTVEWFTNDNLGVNTLQCKMNLKLCWICVFYSTTSQLLKQISSPLIDACNLNITFPSTLLCTIIVQSHRINVYIIVTFIRQSIRATAKWFWVLSCNIMRRSVCVESWVYLLIGLVFPDSLQSFWLVKNLFGLQCLLCFPLT